MPARRQDGFAMVAALILASIMLTTGIALLAIVDTQAGETAKERIGDSTYNLAEGALNAESFLVARSWPVVAPSTSSCSPTNSINGNMTTSHPVQQILENSFSSGDFSGANGNATWKINVCDDDAAQNASEDCNTPVDDVWDDSKLGTAAGWDANRNCRIWVRAQSSLRGQRRAVAALIVVQRPSVLPEGYAVLGGGFSGQLSYASSQLTGGPLLSGLTQRLLDQHKLVDGGKIGVRCGLSSLCVEGVFAGLSSTALKNLLLANDTQQYGSGAAASDDAIAGFRASAQRDEQLQGTDYFRESVSPGSSCIPAGANATSTIFIEVVGTGLGPSQYCTIDTTSNPTYKNVVVGKGAIRIQGSGTVTSVIYGVNRQRQDPPDGLGDDRAARACANLLNNTADPCEVIRVEAGAHVKGGVFADGDTGDINVHPGYTVSPGSCRTANLTNLGSRLPFGSTLLTTSVSLCGDNLRRLLNGSTVNVTVQIRTILGITLSVGIPISLSHVANPNDVLDGFVGQVSGPPSPVTYDPAAISSVKGFGSAGTVTGTFRTIAPN